MDRCTCMHMVEQKVLSALDLKVLDLDWRWNSDHMTLWPFIERPFIEQSLSLAPFHLLDRSEIFLQEM